MPFSCNLAKGYEASYTVSNDGNITVSLRSIKPMNIRAVYFGDANLGFGWSARGRAPWRFIPTIAKPIPAEYEVTTAEDGQGQVVTVMLGNSISPATGLIKSTFVGEIWVPAIHFDLPHGNDLWLFMFRSPSSPLKIFVEKSNLRVSHSSAQADAVIRTGIEAAEGSLLVDVSVHGEGFKKVLLTLQRTSGVSLEQTIGEISSGMSNYSWNPFVRSFEGVVATYSAMDVRQFAVLSKYLGADVKTGFLKDDLVNDFVLCDGPSMSYYLRLSGEKSIVGHEEDGAKIALSY